MVCCKLLHICKPSLANCRYYSIYFISFILGISCHTAFFLPSICTCISVLKFWQNYVGWLGEAKVSCILRHRGVQLILAYSWARPAILVVGKGRGGMFLCLLFLYCHSFSFLPCPSLSSPLLSLLSLFSLSLGDNTKWPTMVDVSLNPNRQNYN